LEELQKEKHKEKVYKKESIRRKRAKEKPHQRRQGLTHDLLFLSSFGSFVVLLS
jgi:hypothetical protein